MRAPESTRSIKPYREQHIPKNLCRGIICHFYASNDYFSTFVEPLSCSVPRIIRPYLDVAIVVELPCLETGSEVLDRKIRHEIGVRRNNKSTRTVSSDTLTSGQASQLSQQFEIYTAVTSVAWMSVLKIYGVSHSSISNVTDYKL
jgi:hypothetical protein